MGCTITGFDSSINVKNAFPLDETTKYEDLVNECSKGNFTFIFEYNDKGENYKEEYDLDLENRVIHGDGYSYNNGSPTAHYSFYSFLRNDKYYNIACEYINDELVVRELPKEKEYRGNWGSWIKDVSEFPNTNIFNNPTQADQGDPVIYRPLALLFGGLMADKDGLITLNNSGYSPSNTASLSFQNNQLDVSLRSNQGGVATHSIKNIGANVIIIPKEVSKYVDSLEA